METASTVREVRKVPPVSTGRLFKVFMVRRMVQTLLTRHITEAHVCASFSVIITQFIGVFVIIKYYALVTGNRKNCICHSSNCQLLGVSYFYRF